MSERHEGDDDRDLQAKIDALPRAIEPGRDLWKGIDARIATKRARPSWWRSPQLAMAAALALCAGGAAALAHRANGPSERAPVASVAPAPAVSAPSVVPVPAALVPEEESYRAALAALTPTYLQRKTALPPADAAKIEAGLRAIATARAATRDALAAHPDDADLRAELDAEYEQEIQTMNDVLDWTTRS